MSNPNPALTIIRREFLVPYSPFNGRQPVIQIWGDGSMSVWASDAQYAQGVVLTREQVEEMFAKWQQYAPRKTVDIEVPL